MEGQPLDDRDRLAALGRTGLLDTLPDPGFDRLTRLAGRLLAAPIALVSLVDHRRQYFKSATGLGELRETPIVHSFCQHVVTTGKPLVVDDARRDERVACIPSTPELDVRAFAGVPLVTASGHILGSFCVIDTQPRSWTSDDIEVLEELAGSVMTEVELGIALRRAKLAQGRLLLMAEASAVLTSLDSTATLQDLASLAVRNLADWCSIAVVAADGTTLQRVAVAHAEPEMEGPAQELKASFPHDASATSGVPQVVRSGQPLLVPVVDDDYLERSHESDDFAQLVRDLGFATLMIVPLVARNKTLGAITLASGPTRTYDDEDLNVAMDLARRAGLALDNARAYEAQREIAGTLQRSLLPPALPKVRHFSVSATYKTPGDTVMVGGDFYDLFPLRGPGWGVAIGDVQGKGSAAAALTALARYTVRAGALTLRNPKQVLRTLNEAVMRESGERFLTVCLMTLQPARDSLRGRVCLAGHPMPFLVRADGEITQIGRPGTLLGVVAEVDLAVVTFDIRAGDYIVMFTDGLLEARRDGKQFGNHGVREVLESCVGLPPAKVIAALEEAVTTFGRGEPRDDMALLVLGRALEETSAEAAG